MITVCPNSIDYAELDVEGKNSLIEKLQERRDKALVNYRKTMRALRSKKPKKIKQPPADLFPELKDLFMTMTEKEKSLFC